MSFYGHLGGFMQALRLSFLIISVWILCVSQGVALEVDFSVLVEANYQSVVNISASRKVSVPQVRSEVPHPRLPPEFQEHVEPLEEFFKKFFQALPEFDPRNFQEQARGDERLGSGSGFIISSDGYILTNNHVIEDADEVIVSLSDRRQFEATVIGTDPRSDIALLKIKAQGLPFVKTGSSDALRVGDWVLAIGSPFGFDFSVTSGIVSAKSRSLPNESYVPFIQTDVAINPGNSGGPLFNLKGEVVGINAQIYSESGGFMGLSFAIPIELAMHAVEQLKTGSTVSRGWLGVIIQEVTPELARSFQMDKPQGALISRILEGSPATRSSLKVGDVIVSFNGRKVRRSSDLPAIVGISPLNVPAVVKVIRGGQEVVFEMKIEQLPTQDSLSQIFTPQPKSNIFKLEVKRDSTNEGVVVTEVFKGPAREGGIKVGDVIISLANISVDSVVDFEEAAASLQDEAVVAVLVYRNDKPLFLAIELK